MSRILRRPMFRGGPVDSRGTGITSGLGYEKGGQIGGGSIAGKTYPDGRYGFENPRLVNLGGGSTATSSPAPTGRLSRAANWIKGIPSWMKASPVAGALGTYGGAGLTGYGLGQLADWATRSTDTPEAYAYRKQAQRDNPWMNMETDLVVDDKGNMTTEGAIVQDEINRLDVGEKPGFFPQGGMEKWYKDRGLEKEYNISTGEKILKDIANKDDDELTEEEKKYKKLLEKYNSLESTINELLKPKESKELTEDEKLAEIEKNKAMIQKAYGSGVADDASAMALSFAKNALAPDATVKSAFAGFFDDESKRPSERKKYKDAATTAAINAFLTGEKTMAEVDAYMSKSLAAERNKYKVAQEYSSSMPWSARRDEKGEKFATDTKFFKSKLPKYLSDIKQPYTSIEFADEEDVKITGDKAQENLNKVFVDVDSDVFFIVEMGPDGKIRKRYLQNILG